MPMRCLPNDNRIFRGFDFLREYFMFPRKFLGFKLEKLERVMPRLAGKDGRHPVRVRRGEQPAAGRRAARNVRALCRARGEPVREDHRPRRDPARTSTNIRSCRTAAAISISSRTACSMSTPTIPGATEKVPVRPLYSAPVESGDRNRGFGTRCGGCRAGAPSRKRNTARRPTIPAPTCSFRSVEPAGIEDDDSVSELSVRALCSNRHLTGASAGRRGRRGFPPAR